MDLYSGIHQEMPDDYWEQRFGMTEKPCVQIIRKERPPVATKQSVEPPTPVAQPISVKERDQVDCGLQFSQPPSA